jgi:PAS domain S-box-containing protein
VFQFFEGDNIVAVAGVGNKESTYDNTDLRQLNLFMNSMWDIIKNKRIALVAAKNKDYSERLISSTPVGIHVYKLEGDNLILTHFNEAAMKILNLESVEDFLGKNILEAFPNVSDEVVSSFKHVAVYGGVYAVPSQNYSDENISGFYSMNSFQLSENEVAVFFTDVSEEIAKDAAVYSSQQKFEAVFNANADVIVVIHLEDGMLIDVNPAFERLSGFSKEEAVGKSILDLNIWVNLSDRERFYNELLTHKEVSGLETVLRLKDGSEKPCVVSSSIVLIEDRPHAVSIIRAK